MKLLGLVLVLAVLAGCAGDGDDEASTRTPAATPAPGPASGSGSEPTSGSEVDALVDQAIDSLAEELDVSPGEISLVRTEPREWPDSSYGCPVYGATYDPGPFDGLRIVLEHDDHEIFFHTGEGNPPKRCLYLD